VRLNTSVVPTGTVFTADSRNSIVHKQSSAGVQSSMVGTDFESFNNVRVGSNGDVFITDMKTKRIRKVTTTGIVLTMAGGSMDFD
jgi:uncharacterized protein (UPF0218 family)